MSLNDTPLPSASPAATVPAGDGPGNCALCEGEPGRLSQWRLRLLERAAESAVTVLEKITADVMAGKSTGQFQLGEATHEGDLGLIYSRIAKALRQALALHAKFEDDSYKTIQERAAEAAARQAREAQRAAALEANGKSHKKRLVERAVRLAMDAELAEDEEKFDRSAVSRELFERLGDFDDYSDCGRKPVSEIVAGICKVMGLKFDPIWWEDEPWAIAEAKAKPAAAQAEWPDLANDDEDDDEADPFGIGIGIGIATGTGPP
jgi:hypothetical protein